jgi:hypothetical protein
MTGRNLPNWIKGYLAYTIGQESPDEFHTWVALSCIAGALRRQVWFDMSYFKVYPNMYTVLVAPPGKCKKTTAMRLGRDILIQVPGMFFSPDSTSRERLINDLTASWANGQSAMTAHSSEFASFLSTSGETMVEFLTDIYDNPSQWQHRTKTSGTSLIRMPYFNLLACTTPDDLARKMSVNAVGIGLTSRVTFVYADKPRKRPEQQALQELLVEDLNTISQISGEYTFDSEDTGAFYDSWYEERVEDPNPTGDPRLAGYYERKHVHWLKVAMCCAAAQSDELVITMQHMVMALEALEMIEPKMLQVYAGVGTNPLQINVNQMWAEVLSNPNGVTYGRILERMYYACSEEQINEVLRVLVATKKIRREDPKKPGDEAKYYPA